MSYTSHHNVHYHTNYVANEPPLVTLDHSEVEEETRNLRNILASARKRDIHRNHGKLFKDRDMKQAFETVFSSRGDFVVLAQTGKGKTYFLHY